MIVDYNAFLSYGIILLIGTLTNYQITVQQQLHMLNMRGKKYLGG